jgi:phosphoadenosine phosphosulfate reductase
MDLEQKAIKRIQTASEMSLYHYGKPLVCTYSGGKDSDVILELFRRGGAYRLKFTTATRQQMPHIQ